MPSSCVEQHFLKYLEGDLLTVLRIVRLLQVWRREGYAIKSEEIDGPVRRYGSEPKGTLETTPIKSPLTDLAFSFSSVSSV
ncbi:hypothetical protein E2C01_076172 [Portunus trituberculatus]|uniref:Uncharacterized protein n=1 Tax=Portunus trituberculatus TaxID=210409 RepID=A0A5B7ILC0_PORTR|nr:hypothetical protein [Portunus trituberculatus]